MLLTRTPYHVEDRVARFESPHMAAIVPEMDDTAVAAGYIIVFQDVRGKYGSEGDYVMTRPPKGPLNPTEVDHATDTYDTSLPGHRITVQVQSSWFPLYDRNPQTFVPNIMLAKPEDFAKATQRVWHTPGQASAIELPVIGAETSRPAQ